MVSSALVYKEPSKWDGHFKSSGNVPSTSSWMYFSRHSIQGQCPSTTHRSHRSTHIGRLCRSKLQSSLGYRLELSGDHFPLHLDRRSPKYAGSRARASRNWFLQSVARDGFPPHAGIGYCLGNTTMVGCSQISQGYERCVFLSNQWDASLLMFPHV